MALFANPHPNNDTNNSHYNEEGRSRGGNGNYRAEGQHSRLVGDLPGTMFGWLKGLILMILKRDRLGVKIDVRTFLWRKTEASRSR